MPDAQITVQQKQVVAERAHFCCEYCLSQVAYSPDPFSVDHIDARAVGGTDEIDNLAFACMGCNGRKFTSSSALDPVTGALADLFHPRKHLWHEHLMWSEDFTLILGLTPIGRATVARLQLNREGVVNLRRLLRRIGKHPPKA
jgi:hypothetical protein